MSDSALKVASQNLRSISASRVAGSVRDGATAELRVIDATYLSCQEVDRVAKFFSPHLSVASPSPHPCSVWGLRVLPDP